MDGILLIDKPKDWTSFDVVAKVRGLIRQSTGQKKPKVGHCGTLDPLATGLLIIVIGSYTKKASELSKKDKTYQVSMKLGETSSTGDEEGEKEYISDNQPTKQEVEEVIRGFIGDIDQIPPAYSAVKVNGQRAYKLARAGKDFKLESRRVTIYEINDIDYHYPIVKFGTTVSSGTYIRSLVEDIGGQLGTGAYMTELQRTHVGKYYLKDARSITDDNLLNYLMFT
ncbi:MAG: tRNA pseudouridine(55) synthase TruB [Candidatus Nomurabacteria bacterium]|nr:MAG: tRNA pseudouridine(55) synthase TruB [Candidatus Nomurabacteria bacterium]